MWLNNFLSLQLPIDVENCSAADLKKVRNLRRQRGKVQETQEVVGEAFDPLKYI